MECKVDQQSFKKALTSLKSVLGTCQHVMFETIEDEGILAIVAESESYFRYTIPVEDIKSGSVMVDYEMVSKIVGTVKKDVVNLKKDTKTSKLMIKAGTKYEIGYDTDVNTPAEPDMDGPKVKKVKIDSKSVGDIKELIKIAKFKVLYSTVEAEGTPCVITNTKDGLTIKMADNAHSIFYTYETPVSKASFVMDINFDEFKNAFALFDSEVTMMIAEGQRVLLKNEAITICLRLLQVRNHHVEQAESIVNENEIYGGVIVINADKFQQVFKSLTCIAEASDSIQAKIDGKSIILNLKSKLGNKSKDTVPCRSKEKASIAMPVGYLTDIVGSLSLSRNIKLQVEKDANNMYRMAGKAEKYSISCVSATV